MSDTGAEQRPAVTELRLSAFRAHRGARFPLAPLTLLAGPSGSGKSTVLNAYEALARLAAGESLGEIFGAAPGGPSAYVPHGTLPDRMGRRGFRIGCTVNGPAGAVRLDVAVQAEPGLRIVGERLTCGDQVLLSTALRDPGRCAVQAVWHTGGAAPVTRAPLPDDQLSTALLPLRVAGTTPGQRQVLAAAEQTVLALRSAFACDPRPESMREPVAAGDGMLRGGCDNFAAVLRRIRTECATRHAALVAAVRAGCAGAGVADLRAEWCPGTGAGLVRAVADRGAAGRIPLEWLGEGELRYTALALVLLTGPGVLEMDPVREVLPARQALAVLADGVDRGLDGRQTRELLALAARMCERGHIRLLGTVMDADRTAGATVLRLGGPADGDGADGDGAEV